MRCRACGGIMKKGEGYTFVCQNCGATELYVESESVVKQRIESDTRLRLAQEQRKAEEEKRLREEAVKYRRIRGKLVLVWMIFCVILCIGCFTQGRTAAGIVTAVQAAALLVSYLIRSGAVRVRSPLLSRLPLMTAAVLLIPVIILFGEKPAEPKKTADPGVEMAEFSWDELAMSGQLPKPASSRGYVWKDGEEELTVYLECTEEQYRQYVKECRKKGFTVDPTESSATFTAFNGEGYRLELIYYEYLNLRLKKPTAEKANQWPSGGLAALLPEPPTTTGQLMWEYPERFRVMLVHVSEKEYTDYVAACMKAGFDQQYRRGEKTFSARNSEGDLLELEYEGFETMRVEMLRPAKKEADNP